MPLPHASHGPPPHSGEDKSTLSLILAIPDHPWTKATKDAAAVRIAMTVAEAGTHDGKLLEIVGEEGLETDDPTLLTSEASGAINADLTLGADVVGVNPLKANEGIASRGVSLHGPGFILSSNEASDLGLGQRENLEQHIRSYANGRDLLQRPRGVMVIDMFGLSEKEVRTQFPEVYQHLLNSVQSSRAEQAKKSPTADALAYLQKFWLHGKPRPEMRLALNGLKRYIATPETSKHRVFQFLDASILADNANWVMASNDAADLGILSSLISLSWILKAGGTLEDRPKFTKTDCFDPFPFPDATPEQRATIAELAEELDATRKAALAEVPGLTMTEIYNLRGLLQSGEKLSAAQEDRARAARAGIVHRLHEQIDAAVADAYGWPADLSPSEIVTRLVALNAERAKEEAEGNIRWLRPDYQIPRFGAKK